MRHWLRGSPPPLHILLALLAVLTAVAAQPSTAEDAQLDARARVIHERVLTLDSHVDVIVPGAVSEYGPGEKDRASLDDLRRGGIDAVTFAIAVGPGPRTPEGVAAARAEAVHAGNNDFADSSRPIGEPQQEFHGLSPLGKRAVAKLNRLGVIIDVSQLTPEGVLQVLELSKAPVVASHSAVRALVDNTRNLSDQELDAIKANGGVVQLTAFNAYLVARPSDYTDRVHALRARFDLAPDYPNTPVGFISGADALSTERHQEFVRGGGTT